MADRPEGDEPEVADDVEWQVDADGTEYFVEDGVRYELADDGYAYAVEEDLAAATDDAGTASVSPPAPPTEASRFSREAEAAGGTEPTADTEATTQIPPVIARSRTQPAAAATPDILLDVSEVRSGYGSLPVLHGVTIQIRRGETAVMLGLNGAGKTTTALNICGALKTWDGTISFDGQDITKSSLKKAVQHGIVMVPEGRRVFPDLTVGKNLQIGAWSQRREDGWTDEQRERVFGYFPRLGERVDQLAGTLSGGEQQMLAIGRGLMANPRLLIIDEASMGLAPVIVHDVFEIIRNINNDGVTVLLIEQNIAALDVADLGLVMEQGRIVKSLRGDRLHDLSEVSDVLMG